MVRCLKTVNPKTLFCNCIEIDVPFARILFHINSASVIQFYHQTTFQVILSLVILAHS